MSFTTIARGDRLAAPAPVGTRGAGNAPAIQTRLVTEASSSRRTKRRVELLTNPYVQVVLREPPPFVPLGEHAADRTPVRAVPALRHVADVLPGKSLTVQDLYDDDLELVRAPNPTRHLQETHRANAQRTLGKAEDFSVTTYNVALLDIEVSLHDVAMLLPGANVLYVLLFPLLFWFRFVTVARPLSPLLEERRPKLPDLIFGKRDDVVMLQEVWRTSDVTWFAKEAEKRGYVAVASPRCECTDGLMTFVRKEAVDPRHPLELISKHYEEQDWLERFGDVKRGYLSLRFVHPTLGPMTVLNTHMEAFPDGWAARMEQARELGLAARGASQRDPQGVVLLGGDLNSGPYYKDDVWRGDDAKEPHWYENALAYGVVEHYSGLSDLAVAGRPAEGAAADVSLSNASLPKGSTPTYPFTASPQSNPLYAQQYGDTEPQARLDHVRGNTRGGRIKVAESSLVFTEDIEVGTRAPNGAPHTVRTKPSDHYGVRVQMRIAPRRSSVAPYAPNALQAPKDEAIRTLAPPRGHSA